MRDLADRVAAGEPPGGLQPQPLPPLLLSGRIPAPLRIPHTPVILPRPPGVTTLSSTSSLWLADREKARREQWAEYERNRRTWLESAEYRTADRKLALTVRNLERCGLLQYDQQANRYDLHPVVRGYASGSLRIEDRDRFGQRVVDHFSQQAQNPYEQVEALDDLRNGLQVIRTLLQMGRMLDACDAYRGGLSDALNFNLEAHAEVLSTLRPFFARDWASPAAVIDDGDFAYVANDAASAFHKLGQLDQALVAQEAALRADFEPRHIWISLARMAWIFAEQNYLARSERFTLLGLKIAELTDNDASVFRARFERFRQLAEMGCWAKAEAVWQVIDSMGRDWPRNIYRPGMAEEAYAWFQFWQGQLTDGLLARAERLARTGRNRPGVRQLHGLRAEWRLDLQEWARAAESLHEAIRMTREAALSDTELETQLALAQFRLGQLTDARAVATRLASRPDPAQLALADLWQAIGDGEQATEHALAAYRWAWADGEPYVRAYELGRAKALLELLGAEVPALPPYDPGQDPPLSLEIEIQARIEELRAERGN